MTGLLASIANSLAKNNNRIFTFSTFNTKYIFIKLNLWRKRK
ncbi:hypothetical protein ACLIBH_10070 [Virgibacillus sp. W0430]